MTAIRRFVVAVGVLGLVLLLNSTGRSKAAEAPRPHIVFIVADDLGRADPGFMGGKDIKTPQLDKLAAGGAILDSFYVQPVCSPTRATLMTGRYPTRTGVYGIVRPHAKWGLPLEERTLAVALHEAGYQTAICGKWHLGEFQRDYLPTRRGFDLQYGHYFGAIDYFTKQRDGHRDWHRNDEPSADQGYSTHLIAKEAVRVVRERAKDKPLFLYVPFNAVHAPHQVPESYLKPYSHLKGNRQKYAGMLAAMDEAIGQIVAAIDETGIRKETLIIFSSDNGGPSPGKVTDNGSLRAGKGTIYEGGVRVCAFANWSSQIPAGSVVKEPLHMVDWYPTLVKLARGSLQQKLSVDGLDAWPAITQAAKSPHDAILLCAQPHKAAVRAGNWKLLLNANDQDDEDAPATANARPAKGKKKQAAAKDNVQLYDLSTDLSEQHNLAEQQPQRVQELRAKLNDFLKDAVKPGNE